MHEEYPTNSDGLVVSEGTWTYKIPTVDTIPKQFNVHVLNSGSHQKRVLSSKGTYFFSIITKPDYALDYALFLPF